MDNIKKTRGRPRKEPVEEVIKKPKGRPRKEPVEEVIKKPNNEQDVKKPRGRPRKEPVDEVIKKQIETPSNIRIKNYKKIRDLIKDVGEFRIDGKDIYIGNVKIIKKIGTDSKYGLILLGEIEGYKIALKITKYNPKKTNELETLKTVTNAVLANKANNLPILYDYKIREGIDDYLKFPKIFHKFLKNPYIIYFNELADGDLKQFLNDNYDNEELVINALKQVLISLIEFYKITGKFHNDCHWGNFLYYKNQGYLFVIWDLDTSTEFHKTKYKITGDIEKILPSFLNKDDKIKGYMSNDKPYGENVKKIIMDLYKNIILNDKASFYKLGYSPEKLNELISIILNKII